MGDVYFKDTASGTAGESERIPGAWSERGEVSGAGRIAPVERASKSARAS